MSKLISIAEMFRRIYERYTSESFTKRIAHFILFTISTIFSVNLFWNLAGVLFYQIVWASFAVAIELMKVNMFMRVKHHFRGLTKKNLVSIIPTMILLASYLVSAGLSGVATLGFAMNSIEQQSFMTENKNAVVTNLVEANSVADKSMELLNKAIESTISEKEKMSASDGIYHTGQAKLTNDILILLEQSNNIVESKREISEELSQKEDGYNVVASNIFTQIGQTPQINKSGKEVIFIIFLTLVILLEVMLCITSGEIHEDVSVGSMRKKNLERYVNALFESTGNRLNSDTKISEISGLDFTDCKKYRKYLTHKEFGGIPLLEYGRGYSKSEFTKEEIIAIIKNS